MTESQQELASLYAIGAATPEECREAESLVASDATFRALVDELQGAASAVALTVSPRVAGPGPELKSRVMRSVFGRASPAGDALPGIDLEPGEALVVTDADGRVEWVNGAFTELCGYALDELRGQKPGRMLQGPLTDRETSLRMSAAIREADFCTEEILNYHKDGSPYWVAVTISPILDAGRRPRGFMALEREIEGRAIPVGQAR